MSGESAPVYRRTHRFNGEPDVRFASRFGPMGIWISYRDWFFVQGVGPAKHEWGYGKCRIGTSTVDLRADVVPDPAGGYAIESLRGDRYFAPKHGWQTVHSERLTKKQIAYATPILAAEVNAAMAGVAPETIEACHRRGIELDIRSVREELAHRQREMGKAVEAAQAQYETIRALEREIGAGFTPVPAHLTAAEIDVDAAMREIDAFMAGERARALGGGS